MAYVNDDYLDEIAGAGGTLVNYIGLIDETDTEISGGDYSRLSVSWDESETGVLRPATDLTFDIPENTIVAGWRGYETDTSTTALIGSSLTEESFADAGQYTLIADQTSINHALSS